MPRSHPIFILQRSRTTASDGWSSGECSGQSRNAQSLTGGGGGGGGDTSLLHLPQNTYIRPAQRHTLVQEFPCVSHYVLRHRRSVPDTRRLANRNSGCLFSLYRVGQKEKPGLIVTEANEWLISLLHGNAITRILVK